MNERTIGLIYKGMKEQLDERKMNERTIGKRKMNERTVG